MAYVHTKLKAVSVHGMEAHGAAGTAPLILKIGTLQLKCDGTR